MSTIRFEAALQSNGTAGALLALPKSASAKLPSQGTIMIEGVINDGNGDGSYKT